MGEMVTAKCAHCGGEMTQETVARYSRGFGIAILILGLLFCVFLPGLLLLALPVVLIGAYLGWSSRSVWNCTSCGAMVERAVSK